MNKFMLGASTAAHQVEGDNIHSDFWLMEQMQNTNFKEPSFKAVDHYNRFEEDILLLKNAGLNSYRFSIEWARIEPEKDHFDLKEIEHYRSVLEACKRNNITPIVTLHHFSSPAWLISFNGWENEETIHLFARYCLFVVEHLKDCLEYICTINEANMGLQIANKISASNLQVGLNNKIFNNPELQNELKSLFNTNIANTFLSPRTLNGDSIIMQAHLEAKKNNKGHQADNKGGFNFVIA